MLTVRTVADLRAALDPPRRAGQTIGLVPTMGAFHAGHRSLMARARETDDVVVVSLFVNPTQFGRGEDLDAYPRDEARDAAIAHAEGVDLLFAPTVEEVYPPGAATTVSVGALTEGLCAVERPGHFAGVATVVTKLLVMAAPDRAYFGAKDAQQLAVIRRLARDLHLPVEIVGCPTVRDADGLALSSRNAYLNAAERERAGALSEALGGAADAVAAGERDGEVLRSRAKRLLRVRGVEPEYVELVDPDDLRPVAVLDGAPVLLAIAARVGRARLIDNTTLEPSQIPCNA